MSGHLQCATGAIAWHGLSSDVLTLAHLSSCEGVHIEEWQCHEQLNKKAQHGGFARPASEFVT